MLRRLEGKIADGIITVHTGRVLFKDLLALLKRDYKSKGRRSESDLIRRIDKHIEPVLGDVKASTINATIITEYVERRQIKKASNASINRELAAIKRAYKLGKKSGLVLVDPYIEMLPEDNIRQGFFNDTQFRSVLKHASAMLKDVLVFGYYTGWRIDSILHLEWSNVSDDAMRLRANQTKNRKGTTFPLDPFPELRAALENRKAAAKGLITPWVFQRKANRVISVRKAWEIARAKANIPGRLIHDLRRTAVRNLKQAGWSDTEIMQMVGLKTLSMLVRYGITTEADILNKAKAMVASNTK